MANGTRNTTGDVKVADYGVPVYFNANNGRFYATVGERELSSETIDNLRNAIDRAEKVAKKFERFEAFAASGFGQRTYEMVTVTSYAGEQDFWTTDARGNRLKRSGTWLYRKTDDNLARVNSIVELRKQERALAEQRSELEHKLVHIDIPSEE